MNIDKNNILEKKTIVVTRAKSQSIEFIQQLKNLGATVINFPTIEIKPTNLDLLENYLKNIQVYNWIIFTSTNSVKIFFETFSKIGLEKNTLEKIKFAVVGSKTNKCLETYGFSSNLIPNEYTSESLLNIFSKINIENKKIFLPISALAKNTLKDELKKKKAIVDTLQIYNTTLPKIEDLDFIINQFLNCKIDYITFTSPSTVKNFASLLENHNINKLLENVNIVSIGQITSQTIKDLLNIIPLEPNENTIEGILEKIIFDTKKHLI